MAKMKVSKLEVSQKDIKELANDIDFAIDPFQVSVIYKALSATTWFLSAMRQIGKTQLAVLYMLICALAGYKVLYLAHRADTTREVMNRTLSYVYRLQSAGLIDKISASNGFQEVYFKSGGRIFFRTRTAGVSVGLTFDVIVWDEAQRISTAIIEEVTPILTQSDIKKQLFIGTPPTDDDWRLFPNSPFMAAKLKKYKNYTEFSAAEKYTDDLTIDLELARKANPAWRRTPGYWTMLKDQMENMSHKEFCRQFMGVWDLPENAVIHEPEFDGNEARAFLTDRAIRASRYYASIGVVPESQKAFICVTDGNITELATVIDLEFGSLDAVVEWVRARARWIRMVRIPANQRGKAIADELKMLHLGAKVKLTTLPDLSSAIKRFKDYTAAGSLKVYDGIVEDFAVKNALTSFWIGFDARSGSSVINAAIPEDQALALGLLNATFDRRMMDKLASWSEKEEKDLAAAAQEAGSDIDEVSRNVQRIAARFQGAADQPKKKRVYGA